MTAFEVREARDLAWMRARAASWRCGRCLPPEVFYEEPFAELPPDDELEDLLSDADFSTTDGRTTDDTDLSTDIHRYPQISTDIHRLTE